MTYIPGGGGGGGLEYSIIDVNTVADNAYGDNNNHLDKWVAIVRKGKTLYSFNGDGLGVSTDDPWSAINWSQRDAQTTQWSWDDLAIGIMVRNSAANALAYEYRFSHLDISQVKTMV